MQTQKTIGALPMVNLRSIREAMDRIRGSIVITPFVHSEKLSQQTGNSIFLKLENLQMTGAFKERGALHKILMLTEDERRRGVIAASAGNHAQAVAYHATKRGIKAQICMPLTTPLVKVSATRGYGAEVILAGANYDEACEEALRRCKEQKLTFIHPFGWRRLDRRRRLRGEGDESEDSSDRSAILQAGLHEGGDRKK